MLHYLNQIAFSPFGKTLKQPEDGEPLAITDTAAKRFFCYTEPTYLSTAEGLCALCVYQQGQVHAFLLDKPVELYAGVPFCLTAVDGACMVTAHVSGHPHSFPAPAMFSPIQRRPKLVINNIITFFYQEKEFGLRHTPEMHNFYELTYVDSGTVVNRVDGQNFTAAQGELMFFFPGQSHMQAVPEQESASFFTVSFSMTLEGADVLKNKVLQADGVIRAIYSNILTEYESPDEYSPDMLVGYLHEIILRLMRRSLGPLPAAPDIQENSISNPLVRSATDYIQTHLERRLSLSDVADALKVNPSYISRLFKQQTGRNMTDYIRSQKLTKAKKLLKSGGYTVTEISDLFGFSSVHYFSSCFKKQFGIAPGKYAQMLHE